MPPRVRPTCGRCHDHDPVNFDIRPRKNTYYATCNPCWEGRPTKRYCAGCEQVKPISEFHRHIAHGWQYRCKTCQVENTRTTRAGMNRFWQAENKFKLPHGALQNMFDAQGGRCAICGCTEDKNGRNFAVDHDHDTGVVRALLCMPCNTMLGFAEDDIQILKNAIAYLEEHGKP